MKKKNILILAILVIFLPFSVVAQDTANTAKNGKSKIKEFLLDTFEDVGQWHAYISNDVGYSTVKYIEANPVDKNPEKLIQRSYEQEKADKAAGRTVPVVIDEKVFGVKIDFLKRAWTKLTIKPDAPINIRGTTKKFTFFVIGRQYRHDLSILLKNYRGKEYILPVGRIDHYGWRRMEVNIPVQIDQQDPNYPSRGGLDFVGFQINMNPMEIRGDFYIYFDDLRVQTDLFNEDFHTEDDIPDTW